MGDDDQPVVFGYFFELLDQPCSLRVAILGDNVGVEFAWSLKVIVVEVLGAAGDGRAARIPVGVWCRGG